MIAFVGRALLALLGVMTRPRPPVPDLPPVVPPDAPRLDPLTDDEVAEHLHDGVELWRIDERQIDGGWSGAEWPCLWPPRQHDPTTVRPCWACGNPAGFFAEHAPCSNVPPFTRTAPTLPDGSQLRRNP